MTTNNKDDFLNRKKRYSERKYEAAVAKGMSAIEIAIAASAPVRGTVRGELSIYLLTNGVGTYKVSDLIKALPEECRASADKVDSAIKFLVKKFDLREKIGFMLSYDRIGREVRVLKR